MNPRPLRTAIGAIALLVATTFASPAARATTFAELSIEQFTDASTWIVEGTVQEVWTELDTERMLVWTRARIALSSVHKGPGNPTELIVDSLGGAVGDFSVYVPGQAQFSEGEDVFLFLDQLGERVVPVSKFLGKYTIRRATGETRPHVMTWHGNARDRFDARFLPHPAPEHRQYLDDLRERVQQRLDTGWDGQPIPGISSDRLIQINSVERRMPR